MRSSIDESTGVAGAAFKHVVGHMTSGVTVITGEANGTPFGMTASSVTSLSVDPPMMLACINSGTPTADAIRRAGRYMVNVLGAGQEALALQFARPSADKFDGVRVERGQLGDPVLLDALACIECEVVDSVTGGTHEVFLGRVAHARAHIGEPLAYYRGGFGLFLQVDDEVAYRQIRRAILTDGWGAGPQRVDDVAARLDLDPSAAFHALTRLSFQGLLSWEPDQGYVLRDIDPRLIEAAVDARCAMELGVIDVALPHAPPEEIAQVKAKFDAMAPLLVNDELVDVEGFFAAHTAFHRAIVELSHNPTLVESFVRLDLQELTVRGLHGSQQSSDCFIRTQRQLMTALEAADVTAAREALLHYTELVRQRIRSLAEAATA